MSYFWDIICIQIYRRQDTEIRVYLKCCQSISTGCYLFANSVYLNNDIIIAENCNFNWISGRQIQPLFVLITRQSQTKAKMAPAAKACPVWETVKFWSSKTTLLFYSVYLNKSINIVENCSFRWISGRQIQPLFVLITRQSHMNGRRQPAANAWPTNTWKTCIYRISSIILSCLLLVILMNLYNTAIKYICAGA